MINRRNFLRLASALIAAKAVSLPLRAGVPSNKAVYRGGTVAELEAPVTGEPSTRGQEEFVFRHRHGAIEVPYRKINALEYGQKAGRRLGLSLVVSPLFLLSKKHRHYLTIGYLDEEGRQQAAVFEVGKKIVRSTLAGLEARTGLAVDYEDEAARMAGRR